VADSDGRTADQAGAQAEALSYEQARDELASVVKRLETGGLTLEQSLELWERGERLAAVCERLLDGARARLSAATATAEPAGDGDPDAPF
jgi:exodeoxyribonuclease VII small subunit